MKTQQVVRHTPGPWKAAQAANGEWHVFDPRAQGAQGSMIARGISSGAPHLGEGPACVEANAHLIAAAPELLVAGKRALEILDGIIMGDIPAKEKSMLRAAIAKAEGVPHARG